MREVESADLLIFTTPTYCLRESAPMKSFMDLTFNYWMSHRPRKCMFSKKAVVISTAAGKGAKKAAKSVANALFYWGIPRIWTYGICVQAMSWDGIRSRKKQKIEKDISRIAGKVLRKEHVKAGLRTSSGEADRAYWETNGWLAKERPWKQ